ncbi:aspartate kinase [Sneathia sanguinegens]|uniref:Aspartokinase n=1 Tax=Sneathia sanguinegens TaxID=40543 RepID=A0ABT7HLL0_9FUSO|nr:aspartate kinase [Sneathia sanguinegens]MDK9580977.1 aspartate kinase [Sneathia sanguinegens]
MVVHKYGGSSVATIEKIENIAKHLKKIYESGEKIVVVVSAMGKTTNALIAKAHEITTNPNLRELDRLMSIGENQTIALLAIALNNIGVPSVSLTGEQIPIITKGVHTKNIIETINTNKIDKLLSEGKIVVVAGFQGINSNGDVTTLGRGGSDTTAVALAAALKCKCEIYTDVDGIYRIDPRIYEKATKIKTIQYNEMMELAYLGAGVMEPRAIELGYKYSVPIYVGKSLGEKNGTNIVKECKMEEQEITGISVNSNTLMVTIDGIATYARNLEPIFKKISELGINIDIISQNDVISENGSIAFTTARTDENLLNKLFSSLEMGTDVKVLINKNVAKVSLVGIGIMTHGSVVAKIFEILMDNNLSFHQISTSEISISLIVNENIATKVSELLAQKFKIGG